MYSIQKTIYGAKLEFSGFIESPEMAQWVKESEDMLLKMPPDFGIFVDMRHLKPLPADAQEHMKTGQKLYKQKGMKRSVVILSDAVTTMQFRRIAKETGINQWERYIDASAVTDFETKGVAWLTAGTEPEGK